MIFNRDKNNNLVEMFRDFFKTPTTSNSRPLNPIEQEIFDKIEKYSDENGFKYSKETVNAWMFGKDESQLSDLKTFFEKNPMENWTADNFTNSIAQATKGTSKFKVALSSVGSIAKTALGTVGNVLLSAGISIAISSAISGLMKLGDYIINYKDNIIKAGDAAKEAIDNSFNSFSDSQNSVLDLGNSFSSANKDIKSTEDAIDQVAKKYTELHDGVNSLTNENVSLSDEDYQSYLDICNQISEQYPTLVRGYDSQNNAILNLGNTASDSAEKIRDLYNASLLSASVDMDKELQSLYDGVAQKDSDLKKEEKTLKFQRDNSKEAKELAVDNLDNQNNLSYNDLSKQIDTQHIKLDARKLGDNAYKYFNEITKAMKEAGVAFESTPYEMQVDPKTGEWYQDYGISNIVGSPKQIANLKKRLKTIFATTAEEASQEYNNFEQKLNANKTAQNDNWNIARDAVSKRLQMSTAYQYLDQNIKSALVANSNNIDLTPLNDVSGYDGNFENYINDEFLAPMESLEPKAQAALSNLITLDSSKLTKGEYTSKIWEVLREAFPNSEQTQKQWYNALGFSGIEEEIRNKMQNIGSVFKDNYDDIRNMSIEDINAASEVLKGFDTSLGWDKFISAVDEYKSSAADLGDGPTLASVLADEDNEVSSSIDSLQSDLSSLSDTLSKLKTGDFKDSDLTDLIQQFPQLADQTDNLQNAIVSLQADKLKSTIDKIDDAMSGASADEKAKAKTLKDSLIKSADLSGITSKEINDLFRDIYNIGGEGVSDMASREGAIAAGKFKESFASIMLTEDGREALYKALLDPEIAKSGFDGIMEAVQSNLSDIFNRRIDASNNLLSEISSVQSALNSQSIGTSINYDTFSSEDLKDYRSALEYVNGSMQINTQRVKELTQAKVKEQVATNNSAKAQKQQQYLQNAKQIEELRQKLIDNTNATGLNVDGIQNQINSLLSSNAAIVEQCSQLDVLNASMMESIGIYQQWKDAQNSPEAGDMFDDALTAVQQIDDTLNNTDSELYGRTGREDYKASLDFLIPDTVDKTDENAINSYLDSIASVFTYNESGQRAGLNIEEFCQRAMDQGLMVLDESGENYEVAAGKTMEDFAKGLNMAMPLVQAAFGEMQEFNANWDWSDEGIKTMGDMAVAATEASESLRQLEGNEDLKINLDVSDLETTEEKCSALDDTIVEMNTIKAKPDVDSSTIDQANTVIQYCIAQKQQLEAPAVMNVDTSQVSGKIGEAIGLLQQFQEAQNELEKQQALGLDTSEAQANVDAIAKEIQGLDTNVKATLSIDDSSIDTIQDSISSKLTNEVMVKAGIDDSAIIGFQETKHDAKGEVDWDNDTKKVDAYAAAQKQSNGTVLWSNDISQVKTEFHAEGHINWGNTSAPTNGANSVSGTAHISGTAKVTGDWGNKQPGKTLVGERGREMIVDPHTGRWYTVGDNGAEFVDVPKDAIVFNNPQTEDLLNGGFTASRAVALCSGTNPDIYGKALVSGNAMVTGGISVKQAQKSTISGGVTTKPSSTTDKNTTSVKKNTDTVNDNTEKVKKSSKVLDWVKNRIDWWDKQVKKISDKITDYIDKSLKQSLLKQQISKMNYEIGSNKKGAAAYMKKANKVAKKYTYYNSDGTAIETSVPKKYQKLVQKGAYRIEDMDTSTDQGKALAEAIDQYKTYYDKAQDCKQAVVDLKKEQMELFEQWANMPTETAEQALERLQNGFNGLNATQSRLSAVQTGGSTQKAIADAATESYKSAQAVTDKAQSNLDTATAKADKATTAVNKKKKALLKSKGLTNEQKKAIKSGKTIDTSKITNKTTKKRAEEYNSAVKNKKKADSKKKTAQTKFNTANKNSSSLKTDAEAAIAGYQEGNELSYMDSLTDQNVTQTKQAADINNKAWEETKKNLNAQEKAKKQADDKVSKKAKAIKKKFGSKLSDNQKKKLAAGKEINVDKIKDKSLKKALTAYNKYVTTAAETEQKLNIVTDAESTAAANAAESQTEAAKATVEAIQSKFDNAKTYYEGLLGYQEKYNEMEEANIDLYNAHGNYERSSDYEIKISNTESLRNIAQDKVDELEKRFQEGVDNGTIVEGSQEWINMKSEIVEAKKAVTDYDTSIENLKQQQIGVYYEEQFDRAIEKIDQFKDRIDILNEIISDDMKIDKNTGLLTEWGATSVMLNRNQFSANQEEMRKLLEEKKQIEKDYAAGNFGEKTYDEKMKNVQSQFNSLISSNSSLQNDMLSLVKNQAQAELDALNKVISKRKEALSAKKDYYDYDKTLKDKTKDIQILERQAAALQGSTNAEDKARLAKIQEQLSDAREDLSDTMTDHAFSMQSDALDKLSSDMSDDFDKWSNDISSNVEKMSKAINEAVSNSALSNAQVLNNLSTILKNVGLTDEQVSSTLSGLTGYASGTDYVNKSGMYRVNENGMESVLSKKYGTLTFLNQGDKVFTADFTKRLIDNAGIATQSSQPQFGEMYKELMNAITNTNNQSYEHSTVYNIVVNEATDANAVGDIVVKKIDAYEKKRVRDFKSLR